MLTLSPTHIAGIVRSLRGTLRLDWRPWHRWKLVEQFFVAEILAANGGRHVRSLAPADPLLTSDPDCVGALCDLVATHYPGCGFSLS